jgi:3',5'-cyclic AMP phosphodiesterase CpdA
MISQVLNRSYVLGQLQGAITHLQGVSADHDSRMAFVSNFPGVAPEQVTQSLAVLRDAYNREQQRDAAAQAPAASLAASASPVSPSSPFEDQSFFSRDPMISNFQSALDEYINTRQPNSIVTNAPPDAAQPLNFAITNRSLAPPPPPPAADAAPEGVEQFEQIDPGWVTVLFSKGLSLLSGKHAFKPVPATPCPINNRARVILVGDWGTGLPRAQKVARQMRKVLDDGIQNNIQQHVIHLGDVYYSGWEHEYQTRFLNYWPVAPGEADSISSWSLIGNHDMYSGANGYFDYLLQDARFKKQEQSSFFRIYNDNWDLLGLDSAWGEEGVFQTTGFLQAPQADWITAILSQPSAIPAPGRRKTMLLSHHQLFSIYDSGSIDVAHCGVQPILDSGRIDAWLWGHEHRCIAYQPGYQQVGYTACLGHGGVPVFMDHGLEDPYKYPGRFEYRQFIQSGPDHLGLFGFAILDFDGPNCSVRYRDENGAEFLSEPVPG